MNERPSSTPDRDDARRAERLRLYRAAYSVMRRNGYAGANITEILTEAGLGTRAFYRHFVSKDELLVSMFRDNAEQTAAELHALVGAAGEPRARLESWVDAMLSMGYDARTNEVVRLFAADAVRATFEDAGHAALELLVEPLRLALAAGVADGAFPTCDPEPDAASIHAIVWRIFTDAMNGRATMDRPTARAHVLRFVLPALGIGSDAAPVTPRRAGRA